MALQKKITVRPMFDAAGIALGKEGALATGIPGERADMAPTVASTVTLSAASRYGEIAHGGLVVNPKEGVRYAGSIADGLDVAAGTAVTVATKGHWFVEIALDAKQSISEGATLEADAVAGGALSLSATSGTAGNGKKIYAKVLSGVDYTAESGSGDDAVPEKGAEQFRITSDGKYAVILKVELV